MYTKICYNLLECLPSVQLTHISLPQTGNHLLDSRNTTLLLCKAQSITCALINPPPSHLLKTSMCRMQESVFLKPGRFRGFPHRGCVGVSLCTQPACSPSLQRAICPRDDHKTHALLLALPLIWYMILNSFISFTLEDRKRQDLALFSSWNTPPHCSLSIKTAAVTALLWETPKKQSRKINALHCLFNLGAQSKWKKVTAVWKQWGKQGDGKRTPIWAPHTLFLGNFLRIWMGNLKTL